MGANWIPIKQYIPSSFSLLEAGTNRLNDPRLMVPGLGIATYEDPHFDWNFRSSPQVSLRFVAT